MSNTIIHPRATAAQFPAFEAPETIDPAVFAAPNSSNPNEEWNRQPWAREILAHQALLLGGLGALRVRNDTGTAMPTGSLVYVSGLAGLIEEGDTSSQTSAWIVYGADLRNSSSGRLFWTLTNSGATRTIKLYSRRNHDTVKNGYFSQENLVASGSRTGDGSVTLTAENSSGITGSVAVAYTVDDTDPANILNLYVWDITLAEATAENKFAQFVLQTSLADDALGYAFTHAVIHNLDTSSFGSTGAYVYTSDTPGEFSATSGSNAQKIGRCLVLDADLGVLHFVLPGFGSVTSGTFIDAPSDGKTYGRKDGAWSEASGGLPRGYHAGCTLSNNGSDADHDIDVSAGSWRDSTNTADIILASALTGRQLDATYGTGNGMLDTGAIGSSTKYSIWLIKNPTTEAVGILASLSATSPTMPTGFTLKRRIGWIKTDSSSNIYGFSQRGKSFVLNTYITILSGATPPSSWGNLDMGLPPGTVKAFFQLQFINDSLANRVYLMRGDRLGDTISFSSPAAGVAVYDNYCLWAKSDGTVDHYCTAGGASTIGIYLGGWDDDFNEND